MRRIFEWIASIFVMLGMVALSSIMTLNMTYVYHWVIDRYALTTVTGLSRDALIENYWEIIKYLQLPWIRELHMPDFFMSETGRIHFEEVKVIFLVLYAVLIIFLIAWIVAIIRKFKVLPIFNRGANMTVIVFLLLACFMALDFGKAFVWFHHLFFNNDYWIFHPAFDPVILALPYQLFMICGIIIIAILFLCCLCIKLLYYRYYPRRSK